MKLSIIRNIAAASLLATTTLACAPVVEYHGYFPDVRELLTIKEGSHSKREIEMMMGSPSTVASFDENMWFYINSLHHTYAWKEPVVVSRQVIAIAFDEESQMVKDLSQYSIKDGRIIAFADDVTRTRGRELSVLEQLLGNVGRVSTDQLEDQQQR